MADARPHRRAARARTSARGGGRSATGSRGSSSSVLTRGLPAGPPGRRARRCPAGPAIYCFNHLSWADPFVLMALLPYRPRLWFFGPKEEDMGVGGRNRVMTWTGTAIPYKPGKNDLLEATRRVGAVIASGGVVAIAGEGRIHARETRAPAAERGRGLLRAAVGRPARARSPSTGRAGCGSAAGSRSGWGSRSRSRAGRTARPLADATDAADRRRSHAMVADAPDVPPPGRFGRWLTERFNDWPEGSREAARAALRRVAVWHTSDRPTDAGGTVASTGLSADPTEYRARLADQSDDQIDAWVAELMRDVVDPPRHRQGRRRLPARGAASTSAVSNGCSLPAAGRRRSSGATRKGRLMVPAITLYALVPGIRAQVPDGRDRLIEYLVENFDEIVYV